MKVILGDLNKTSDLDEGVLLATSFEAPFQKEAKNLAA